MHLPAPAALIFACLLFGGLTACAGKAARPHPAHALAWPLAVLADAEGERLGIAGLSPEPLWVPLPALRSARRAAERLLAANPGEAPELWVTSNTVPNAMAFRREGVPVVAITAAMADLLGEDEDAWAALFGHELAHLRLAHQQRAGTRAEAVQAGSSVAAILLAIVGIPFASVVADGAGEVVAKGFSRDDEREADEAGMAYAASAGYSAAGAARLFERLASVDRDRGITLLSTHPGIEERVARARAAGSATAAEAAPR